MLTCLDVYTFACLFEICMRIDKEVVRSPGRDSRICCVNIHHQTGRQSCIQIQTLHAFSHSLLRVRPAISSSSSLRISKELNSQWLPIPKRPRLKAGLNISHSKTNHVWKWISMKLEFYTIFCVCQSVCVWECVCWSVCVGVCVCVILSTYVFLFHSLYMHFICVHLISLSLYQNRSKVNNTINDRTQSSIRRRLDELGLKVETEDEDEDEGCNFHRVIDCIKSLAYLILVFVFVVSACLWSDKRFPYLSRIGPIYTY